MVTRVRHAAGNRFEIRLQNPSDTPLAASTVHYLVVEEGTYTLAEHGIKMEAVKYDSTATSSDISWAGEAQNYKQSYTDPVVIGQVMSAYDSNWSSFWSSNGHKGDSPDPTNLAVGKHVGEDTNVTRGTETLGYLVIEAGSGVSGEYAWQAGITGDVVEGIENSSSPTIVPLNEHFETGIVSTSSMDGSDGGWAILMGADPLAGSAIRMAFDEDQLQDAERRHTTEEISWIVFKAQ